MYPLLADFVLLAASAYAAPKTVLASLPHIIRNLGTYFLKSDLSIPAGQTSIQTTTATAVPIRWNYGIEDNQSQGGNGHLNCTFTGVSFPILTQQGLPGAPLVNYGGHYESVAKTY